MIWCILKFLIFNITIYIYVICMNICKHEYDLWKLVTGQRNCYYFKNIVVRSVKYFHSDLLVCFMSLNVLFYKPWRLGNISLSLSDTQTQRTYYELCINLLYQNILLVHSYIIYSRLYFMKNKGKLRYSNQLIANVFTILINYMWSLHLLLLFVDINLKMFEGKYP